MLHISGLNHAALAPAAYASRMVLPPPMQGSLPAGWLGLYREGVEPSGSLQKGFSSHLIPLFWTCPGAKMNMLFSHGSSSPTCPGWQSVANRECKMPPGREIVLSARLPRGVHFGQGRFLQE
jgi:hypothetical protein